VPARLQKHPSAIINISDDEEVNEDNTNNSGIASDVAGGNWNPPRCKTASLRINPLISATAFAICRLLGLSNTCSGFLVKWASIRLGKTAYWHFLQMTTHGVLANG